MKRRSLFLTVVLTVAVLGEQGCSSKAVVKPAPDSMIRAQVWLEGNSSLQRYYLTAEGLSVQSDLNTGSTLKTLMAVILNRQGRRLVVTLPAKSLKSGDRNMDQNAYAKLKAGDFPDIVFTLGNYVIKAYPESLNTFALMVYGRLKIAGVEKAVVLEPTMTLGIDGIRIYGSQDVSQKDYGISPYSAAFIVTTDDKVVVHYMISVRTK
jgi:hypothetical protein